MKNGGSARAHFMTSCEDGGVTWGRPTRDNGKSSIFCHKNDLLSPNLIEWVKASRASNGKHFCSIWICYQILCLIRCLSRRSATLTRHERIILLRMRSTKWWSFRHSMNDETAGWLYTCVYNFQLNFFQSTLLLGITWPTVEMKCPQQFLLTVRWVRWPLSPFSSYSLSLSGNNKMWSATCTLLSLSLSPSIADRRLDSHTPTVNVSFSRPFCLIGIVPTPKQ